MFGPSTLKFRSLLLAALLSVAFAAPAADSAPLATGSFDNIVAAAKKEGSVTYYTVLAPDQAARLGKEFQKEYGIKLNVVRGTTGTLTQRYSSELAANDVVADILTISSIKYYKDGAAKGTFKKFSPSYLPNLPQWPANAFTDDVAACIALNPFVIAYNTDLVKKEDIPKTWSDVLSPKFQNRLGAPRFTVNTAYEELLYFWYQKFGVGFLHKFKAQNPKYYDSSSPGNQALAAGEFAIYAPSMPHFVQPLIDKGAPINQVFLDLTTGDPDQAGISAKAPHPNAAAVFMNFLLSRKGQEIINHKVSASLLKDIPGSLKLPSKFEMPDVDGTAKNLPMILREVGVHN
ncbi:hypothetical protein CDEF62S_00438 [Castellaniella defragrans]